MLGISLHTELVLLLSSVAFQQHKEKRDWQLMLFTGVLNGLKWDCLKVMATLGKRGDAVLYVTCRQKAFLECCLKVVSVSPK